MLDASAAEIWPAFYRCNKRVVAVDPVAGPPLRQQKRGIAFASVANADLDEDAALCADSPEYFMDHSVFAILRIHLKSVPEQSLRISITGMTLKLEVQQ